MSPLVFLASSRKHISHSCKSCESFVERMSVGTCSSCGATLFQLLLRTSNVRIVQLLQAVVFLQTVPLLYSCTLFVLVFSANLLSSWLVLVVTFFGTNASHLCWRLKVVVLVTITVFFLIRHHAGKTRGYCTVLILLSTWPYGADVHVNNTSQLSKCGCLT